MIPRLRGPGYSLAPLCDWLRPRIELGAVLVEVGVFAGEGTRQFLDSGLFGMVVAVDVWRGGYDADDDASAADMAEARAAFMRGPGADPRVLVAPVDAVEAVEFVGDGPSVVYLDADHREAATEAALRAWLPVVTPGGILSGHDWEQSRHPGVTAAVLRVMGRAPDATFADTSWAYQC